MPSLIALFAAVLLLIALAGLASASGQSLPPGDIPTDTPTVTPTPTATPPYQTTYPLDSGSTLVVDRHWDFGELGIFLAVVAQIALSGLHWMYEIARREGREAQEVRIVDR